MLSILLILIMAAIANIPFAGLTVRYGHPTNAADGVQFGGSDAPQSSLPPMLKIRGDFVWDDAHQTIVAVRYTLTIASWFYESDEATMAANMAAWRRLLSIPGRQLKIEGLGTGFGTIADVANGPQPVSVDLNSVGYLAWECIWTVSFTISECVNSQQPLAWMAFNFDTTWQNDFEGISSRTIAGYIQIALRRLPATPKNVAHVADEARTALTVVCPFGFRRVTNTWNESADKSRLSFVIVDEQLPGDPPPADVTLASGDETFLAGDGAGGFAQADVSLSMSLKVSPNVPRNKAGILFLAAVISKQAAMATSLGNDGTVIPARLSIRNRKFDDARITDCSMSWKLTKCLNAMLVAAGIWKPVKADGTFGEEDIGDYSSWRTSVEALWGNRGTALLASNASDAVIVDLCSNITGKTIATDAQGAISSGPTLPTLACPDVPEDGGWLHHDLQLRVFRRDKQTWHTLARPYLPTTSVGNSVSSSSSKVGLAGPIYSQTDADKDVAEHHGYPEIYIALQFKGLRMVRKPEFPQLRSIAGKNVTFHSSSSPTASPAFSVFTCPVWSMSGWTIYRVSGSVLESEAVGSPSLCGFPQLTQDY